MLIDFYDVWMDRENICNKYWLKLVKFWFIRINKYILNIYLELFYIIYFGDGVVCKWFVMFENIMLKLKVRVVENNL